MMKRKKPIGDREMQTIMITGCSSGFGLETARYFLEQGWKVIATMRVPREDLLPASDRLRLVRLDVTSAQSIAEAIAEAGEIDVLVNNAGVGMLNALEGASHEAIANLFATNTLGTIAMTQADFPGSERAVAGRSLISPRRSPCSRCPCWRSIPRVKRR